MRHFILTGALIIGSFTSLGSAAQPAHTERHAYNEIHTQELKAWYDQGKEMIVIDARSEPYYDGTLLPEAQWISYEASDYDVNAAIPSKNSLVVVYCWSPACPASQYMVDRLVAAGYTNIYKYTEGLQDWMQKGYPTLKR